MTKKMNPIVGYFWIAVSLAWFVGCVYGMFWAAGWVYGTYADHEARSLIQIQRFASDVEIEKVIDSELFTPGTDYTLKNIHRTRCVRVGLTDKVSGVRDTAYFWTDLTVGTAYDLTELKARLCMMPRTTPFRPLAD